MTFWSLVMVGVLVQRRGRGCATPTSSTPAAAPVEPQPTPSVRLSRDFGRRGQGVASGNSRAHGSRRRAGPRTTPAQKKHDRGWGRPRMRYPAAEKLEIIRLVEQ